MDLSVALSRPRLIAAAACFLVGVIVLGFGLVARPAAPTAPDLPIAAVDLPPLEAVPPEGDAPAELIVYVSGAVPHPDVYLLPPGARVKDAVVAAGGLTPDAAVEQLNLAEALSDAAHIHVPTMVEATAPGPAEPAAGSDSAGLLDLNRATAADLEDLPGIGATLAERIVARRAEAGPYSAVEELREVTGIGEKLYSQIAPLLTVKP
ncbi:MAG: ComEA family DNA-binding protein [Chloroflexales bacterium]|nr:ComEA family DNA-binding protein [Chloroflexales bacterium]